MPKRILFLTLKIFSATGGIEKVCKIAGKALLESNAAVKIFSMYDSSSQVDEKYFDQQVFSGFNKKKIRFSIESLRQGRKSDVVIISHINLLMIGYLIKFFSPRTRLILMAHGIEVWQPIPAWKKKMLYKCDRILAVSSFTKEKIRSLYGIDEKCVVLHNCLDPYLPAPPPKNEKLLNERYGISDENFTLLTVTRIAADEKYKGHEKVITAMHTIIDKYPHLRYLVIGKYDESEKEKLTELIEGYQLTGKVIIAGFIPTEKLALHYAMADAFIMPSSGEGFGIVFIEAMYYGLPVIAGNKDGSADALDNGRLGLLVHPESIEEIASAIEEVICNTSRHKPDTNLLMQKFSYPVYKNNLYTILEKLYN